MRNRSSAPHGLTAEDWHLLLRPRLLLMVCASALTGALLAPGGAAAGDILSAVSAVALLSTAGTIINQLQERDLDACMARTRNRPLVTGRLAPSSALLLAVLALAGGLALLSPWPQALGLGLLSLAWYNFVYTPLKRRTALAVLPGSLCGALPPLIGWVCAGGSLADYRVLLLAGLLAIWQVPHFMLLALRYRADYERAGLPVFAEKLSPGGVTRVVTVWTLAAALAALALAGFGGASGLAGRLLLPALGSWLVYGLWRQVRQGSLVPLFMRINLFMLFCLLILVVDRLV